MHANDTSYTNCAPVVFVLTRVLLMVVWNVDNKYTMHTYVKEAVLPIA